MPPENKRKTIGSWGEELAADFLRDRNYHIIAQNYQKPWGEIDLIAKKDGVITFCEVKTNSQNDAKVFSPELRVNSKKAKHILRTAKIFMGEHYPHTEWRIDIIAIVIDKFKRQATIRHFKNAVADLY